MAFLDDFRDLLDKSGTFEIESTIKNSEGVPTKSWTTEQVVSCGFWTDNSQETNINDKFVDQNIGQIIVDPYDLTFVPTTKHRCSINNTLYYIEGVDDSVNQGEVYFLKYRREK